MEYKKLFKEDNLKIKERYVLSMERIEKMLTEHTVQTEAAQYFYCVAKFVLMIKEFLEKKDSKKDVTLEQCEQWNQKLYFDILPQNYDKSYANPSYASQKLGAEYGPLLSFLYTEIRGMIVYAYEDRLTDITILNELFIEIYNYFEETEEPEVRDLKKTIYWFISDYSDITVTYRTREAVDPELDFATRIIMDSDLEDLRYLYRYGEYIGENERKTATFLNSLSQEEIDQIARTYTEGYRLGFLHAKKDLSKKGTVNIRYFLGFERIVRAAIKNFEEMGLEPVIYRAAINVINKKQNLVIGYASLSPNKQYGYDHRYDSALFIDRDFNERKLGVLQASYERYEDLAAQMAGPAVIEIFGEKEFEPQNKKEVYQLSEKQQKLMVAYQRGAGKIVNEYIKGEERSFTIIAFPIPEIGKNFQEIFEETVRINTLDQTEYEKIQETIIQALDSGMKVRIKGEGNNQTDIEVALHKLQNDKQTNFENCLADVNIPLGEVFTSPKLNGTNGIVHVSEVYLEGVQYKDFKIQVKDGMVVSYSCNNFDSEEENKNLIYENVMFHHETLPMGEFAIGTNTTAYAMAKKFKILHQLPILIVEKMGPHFAFGDTCYSFEEDVKVYNPDGKEVIAKENEVSALRNKDVKKAYFNCHTDITIPYEEIGEIAVITEENEKIPIIQKGRFVLLGTEKLNKPMENISI